jgi:hypothetical protein
MRQTLLTRSHSEIKIDLGIKTQIRNKTRIIREEPVKKRKDIRPEDQGVVYFPVIKAKVVQKKKL